MTHGAGDFLSGSSQRRPHGSRLDDFEGLINMICRLYYLCVMGGQYTDEFDAWWQTLDADEQESSETEFQ